ncbi:element excision factor XisI family protein [Phormidesmis sp. 146-33]
MDKLNSYRNILHKLLSEHTLLMSKPERVTSTVIVSEDQNHFMVVNEGWEGKKRIHSLIFHAEIRNGKLWMHHDGIDRGITEDLVAAGIPQDQIVLAFHSPEIRSHTGYAVV